MQYRYISDAKVCNHIALGGNYIRRDYVWSNQRIKSIFRGMKQRCYNPNDKAYCFYGSKGIQIYSEWLDNPKSFEDWAIENGYNDNLTIDRIDEDKDYCPDNCRWVTLKDNARYKSTTHLITVGDITKTGREWSNYLNLGVATINRYVREYGQTKTIKLIQAMLADKNRDNKYRTSRTSWFDIYDIH
jgi:hypothetical protein